MDNYNQKDGFFNRAVIKSAKEIQCKKCPERVVFVLRDKEHEFSIGLSSVVECLAFAVKNGDLPKLPRHWVSMIDDIYGTDFSFDDEICYHDYTEMKRE